MSDSFQTEIPKARVNITLDIETNGARQKKELPLKLLLIGDFSKSNSIIPIRNRERININKNNFDQVMAELKPNLNFSIPNIIHYDHNGDSAINISLSFNKFHDFQPDHIVTQVPILNKLLAMRNLLKDLKANLLDNTHFRHALENLAQDKTSLKILRDQLHHNAPLEDQEII